MKNNFTLIVDHGTVQISAAVDETVLRFLVTETKCKNKTQFVGEINVLSDFEKLNQAFANVNEVFQFLKETKNVKVDFQRPSVTLFDYLGTKKIIQIADIQLRKIREHTSSSDQSEQTESTSCPLSEVVLQSSTPNKMKNQMIKQCLKILSLEIRALKNNNPRNATLGHTLNMEKKQSMNYLQGDQIFFQKIREEISSIKQQIQIRNSNEQKFNELRKQLLEKISRESEKVKNQSTELFEKCMSEVTSFKEEFQNAMQKNQSTDQSMSMFIAQKIQNVKKEFYSEINTMRNSLKSQLQKLGKQTQERIIKEQSQIMDLKEQINKKNVIPLELFQFNEKKEQHSIEFVEIKQINEVEMKKQKIIEAHKNQPSYYRFSFDGNILTLDKQHNAEIINFVISKRIVQNSYEFRVKILKMKRKSIDIGVLDYYQFIDYQTGRIQNYNQVYLRSDGTRGANLGKSRVTILEGQNVVVKVDTINGIIKYFIDNNQVTSCKVDFLKQKKRHLYPFIGLAYKGDSVQFSY